MTITFEGEQSREKDVQSARSDLELDSTSENSTHNLSISTQPTFSSGHSNTRFANFFGPEIFQTVLRHPAAAHQFRKFAHSRLCGENLAFLEKVDQYHQSLNQITKILFEIHRNFVSVDSVSQINLPENVVEQVNKNLKRLLSSTMPGMESIFLAAQNDIEKLVASDTYPRFVRHQMTLSATRALATDKSKYAGLGDCFVLTNPNIADNPIVYASDGFVKVTGYERNEIIPRNCRFLQSRQTDQESVKRIKMSLDPPIECVELLLNIRKNGEPFWNLLYTAPLYDPNGKLAFFIGGQIDVSTTIHNTSEVLRVLSYDNDGEETALQSMPPQPVKPQRTNFFSTFRKPRPVQLRASGMESKLLSNQNNLSLEEQREAFYAAYSRYIIININTMLISFYSSGAEGVFCHPNTGSTSQTRKQIVGQDVFRFLSHHSASRLSKNYKSHVNAALKSGQAVSVDIALCTQRGAHAKKFVTHWTPLKNDASVTSFAVLTLSSEYEKEVQEY